MRILIFNTNYYPNISGGAEISTQLLAETLVTMGNDVWVCTLADKNDVKDVNGVHVIYASFRNIYWSFHGTKSKIKKVIWHLVDVYNPFFVGYIENLIDDIKPEVIHTNNICGFSCCIWDVAKKKNIPIVHTLRDYYLICYKSTMFSDGKRCESPCINCRIASSIPKLLSQKVDAVVGISQFILDRHLSLGYFENAKYKKAIYNSVAIKQKQGERDNHVIGFMGSLFPNKGVERLLSDFVRLQREDYVLEIAGTGDAQYEQFLKSRYCQQNIKFIGRVDATEFLSHISVLVVPSEWDEPFGRVIVEAISCGCPVFVSNRGGMPELVPPTNGRIFQLEDPDSLYCLLNDFVCGKMVFNVFFDNGIFNRNVIAMHYYKLYSQVFED